MSEPHYLLPESLRKALLDYLMTRPCGEVLQGVQALNALDRVTERSAEDRVDYSIEQMG